MANQSGQSASGIVQNSNGGELQDEPDDYHTDYLSGVSHSMLNTFRQSVGDFHNKYVLGKWDNKRVKAFDFGSAFHAWILERDLFWEKVALQPCHNKVGAKNKAAWEEFSIQEKKKAWISVSEMEQIKEMEAAVLEDSEASKWAVHLAGINEKMVAWKGTKESMGVACSVKCKPDRYLPDEMTGLATDVVVDLKTTGDVSADAVAKSAASFNYHCQAALYCSGVEAINDGVTCRHISVFVSKNPPYEVASVEYSPEALEVGRAMNRKTLIELADCMAYKQFSGRMGNKLTTLDLPQWYYRKWQAENEVPNTA